MLPNVWDAGLSKGQVEESAQIAQTQGTKVLQLKHREVVRAECSGAPTLVQLLPHKVGCERPTAMIKPMPAMDMADESSGCWVLFVGGRPGELFDKFGCYVSPV